jgi:hypothetical protein
MNLSKPFITGFYAILFLIIPLTGFSQNDSIGISAKKNLPDTASKHSLYTGLGYGSNMVYLGSTISGNQPFEYASLVYGFNNELYAGISAVHTSGIEPFLNSFTGYFNYSHVFNSWFDISTGLSAYKFNQPLEDSLITGFLYGDLTLGFDWKILYTKISAGALFADESNMYFQVRNSRFFQTTEIFKGKAYVSFDPYFNILFGNFQKSETATGTYFTHPGSFGRWMRYKQRPVYTSYSQSFGLMEIDFGIPVALNFDRFVIEAEPCYLFQTFETELSAPSGFVFLLSAFFKIF